MLGEYKRKRNFKATPEPNGNENLDVENSTITDNSSTSNNNNNNLSKLRPRFVVQKHEATRLHYDFRLESVKENVLLSWAVPKGPSLDPSIKRLAIQTEDHPVDYLSFEGIIPQGNYGAGTVIVWDIGEYSVEKGVFSKSITKDNTVEDSEFKDVSEIVKKDRKITFTLYGHKLKGKFSLVRTRNENQWLFIKLKDEFALDLSHDNKDGEHDITKSRPESVLTGKTNMDLLQYKYKYKYKYKKNPTTKNDVKAQNIGKKSSTEITNNLDTLNTSRDHDPNENNVNCN